VLKTQICVTRPQCVKLSNEIKKGFHLRCCLLYSGHHIIHFYLTHIFTASLPSHQSPELKLLTDRQRVKEFVQIRCQEVLLVTLDAFCALSSRTLSPCWVIRALSVSAERADTDVDGTDTPGFQSMPVATVKSDFNVNSFLTSVSITS